MKGLLSSCSAEDLAKIIERSNSHAECLREIGYVAVSGTMLQQLKDKIKEFNIDTSHFGCNKKPPVIWTREEIFVKDATCCQKVLRKWFLKERVEYKCSICGQEPFWNGKEMIMILDHINGENHDNRLENLRWVCPNCNSQLDTTNGKNIKNKHKVEHKYFCSECGKPVSRGQTICRKCSSLKSRKVTRPNVLDFAKMVKEIGFTGVGRKYGLSGKAVQKWCDEYKIPHTRKELIAWYNQQVGIVEIEKIKGVFNQPKPVKQIDVTTGKVINIFPSQKAACEALGVTHSDHIGQVCKGNRKTAYKYFWQYN